ncbi:MAG: GNAT family N-acetyltransferase, partial [bacterium]
MRIEQIDIRNATEQQYTAYNAFLNAMRAERLPGDPPIPLEEDIQRWRTIPSFLDVRLWAGTERGEVVAYASTTLQRVDENKHALEFNIEVDAAQRRRGIGTRLLDAIAGLTRREGRRLLITSSRSTIPAGEGFLRRIGATVGLENHTNQLDLKDLNRDLL